MRLRLNNQGPTPLREQLTAQIVLAIAAGDLKPGDRLPTTRELSRRHRIHPNTVSAAYQELVQQGWVESHKGSGVYVSDKRARKHNPDTLVSELLAKARALGISQEDLQAAWNRQTRIRPLIIVDPDLELRQILLYEVRQAVHTPVSEASPGEANVQDAIVLAMPSKIELLPKDADCIPLRIQPVQGFAARYSLVPPEWLIAVVSRWKGFLQMTRTMLAACGCDLDSVMFRDARESDWQNGLTLANVIICDSLTSEFVPAVPHVITYRLLSDDFLSELKEQCS